MLVFAETQKNASQHVFSRFQQGPPQLLQGPSDSSQRSCEGMQYPRQSVPPQSKQVHFLAFAFAALLAGQTVADKCTFALHMGLLLPKECIFAI